ncbi:MAG: glycosyltransferase [Pseudomonadota bacterium]
MALMEYALALAEVHEVHILTSGIPGEPTIEKHESLNLTVHRAPVIGRSARATASFVSMASFLSSGIKIGKALMRDIQFDVINTWFAIPTGPVGSALSKHSGVPNVLTIIGGDIYDPSKWYSPHRFPVSKFVVKRLIKSAAALAAISSDIVDRAREYLDLEREVKVVPLGVSRPEFTAISRSSCGLADDKKYVVSVGRLVRRKDYPTLIMALKESGLTDTELLILGDGPEKENLQQLVSELGMEDRVHFKGFVSDEEKFQYLSNADLFALVSLHEGFGLVYLEAMYCGLPVIAANEGGQTDILQSGVNGALVPVGNVEELSKALSKYLSSNELASQVANANKARFDKFDVKNLAERYIELFETAIEKNKAASK